MDVLLQDLRSALRAMRRAPGTTAAILATLALGIGTTTALFSFLNGVLLRPLPYPEPGRIVRIQETSPERGITGTRVSPANYLDWRERARSFAAMSPLGGRSFVASDDGAPERLQASWVTREFFDVMGVLPARGRLWSSQEEADGTPVALLSHSLWQRRWGGEEITGRDVVLEGETFRVLGVLPAGFEFPDGAQLWMPVAPALENAEQLRGARYLQVVGRLDHGVSMEAARAEMHAIAAELADLYPETNRGYDARVVRLHADMVAGVRPALLVLTTGVFLLLLSALGNAANLLLARATGRTHEIAVRAALGAGRPRIIRQLLVESVTMAMLAGGLGVLGAWWLADLMVSLAPSDVPRLDAVTIDATVLGFAVAASVIVGTAFGLAPAWHAAEPDPAGRLRRGGRADVDMGRGRTRRGLIVAEVALSTILLVGSALLLNSFVRLTSVSPGFDPRELSTLEVSLPSSRYPEDSGRAAFFAQLLERLRALPGVDGVGATTNYPLSGTNMAFAFSGADLDGNGAVPADYRAISEDYFATMRIPLLGGRTFRAGDDRDGAPVAIVNRTAAERYFGGEALGRRIRITYADDPERRIVGVVEDVRHASLDGDPRPEMYVPFRQTPWSFMRLVVRSDRSTAALATELREAVWTVDPDQPVGPIRAMTDVVTASVADRRFTLVLLGAMGASALLLAVLGMYGVLAHAVGRRTHEIGIRMALGADAGRVAGLLIADGARLAGTGVAMGLAVALLASRALREQLYGIGPSDPLTYLAVTVLLLALALAACALPARRATRIEPSRALRSGS